MKELSIEEKAKAYDMALENAKHYHSEMGDDICCVLEECFPILKESEDDVMRAMAIKAVHAPEAQSCIKSWGINPDDVIAWLEKQKERGPLSKDEEYTLARIIEYLEDNDCPSEWKNLLHDVYAFPYQKEQKEDVTRNKIAEYLKKLILDQSQRGAHMLDYEGRVEEEVDFIISIAKKELKKVEQKSADKVEPKFKVGNWYQCTKDFFGKGVTFDKNTAYYCAKEGCLQDEYGCHIAIVKDLYDNFKLWTIDDVKNGDVLAAHECIVLFKEIDGLNIKCHCTYHFMNNPSFYVNTLQNKSAFHPATKEQRDLLFQKIKEADYEWNTKELKLKTIEQKYDVSDNDSEKRFVQGDDRDKELSLSLQIQAYLNTASDELYALGKPLCSEKHIKDIHKCMLMWKKLYDSYFHHIYTWSEEDEEMWIDAIKYLELFDAQGIHGDVAVSCIEWLKSLKERHAWKKSLATADLENSLCDIQDGYSDTSYEYRILGEAIEFIRCTEPQPHWKPSKEQITELHRVISGCSYDIEPLVEIEKHLKKLMEE